ncbi:hypothetical protein CEXT_436301 [Caerostris extrusa]|uniref:Uncharacterized protein n=1 Tax=Caerostris extrusa TaxID=172846 RepID=A0AAV4VA98_CAEEX|nr:hypothetical protein CEXT_436301 [Caerostris extrusa]
MPQIIYDSPNNPVVLNSADINAAKATTSVTLIFIHKSVLLARVALRLSCNIVAITCDTGWNLLPHIKAATPPPRAPPRSHLNH